MLMDGRGGGLQHIDDLFRIASDAASDFIFVKDLEGRFVYVNPACAALFGAPVAAIVGTNDDAWYGPEAAAQIREVDRAVREGGGPKEGEREHTIGGRTRLVAMKTMRHVGGDGTVLGIVGVGRDLTDARAEQASIRAERDMYATMERVVPGAFATYRMSPDGAFSMPYASPAIEELFGATPEELVRDVSIVRERSHPEDRARVEAAIASSARDLTLLRCDYRIHHPWRGEIWVEVLASPLREPDGVVTWHGFVLEATARKRVERELQDHIQRLAALVASSPGAIHSFRRAPDGSYSFPYVSPALEHLYGIDPSSLVVDANAALALIHPDDAGPVLAQVEESARTLSPWSGEFRVRNPVRGEIWVEGHSTPTRMEDGSIVWHGVLIDITERRRASSQLRDSEAILRSIVETVPGYLLRIDREYRVQFINQSTPRFDREYVLGRSLDDLVPTAMKPRVQRAIEHVFETGELASYELETVGADGVARWFDTRVGPVFDGDHVVAVTLASSDITERKLAELELRASEARYRQLVELLPDAVFVQVDGSITFCNAAFVRLMRGASPAQLHGRRHLELLHPDERPGMEAQLAAMRRDGASMTPAIQTLIALDGTSRRVSVVGTPITVHERPAVLFVVHDLSARQRTEHLLASVLESVNDAILTIDARGTVLACNPATSRMFGYPAGEVLGHNVHLLMPEPYRREHDTYITSYLRTGEAKVIGIGREVVGRRQDGSTFPIELSVTAFQLDGAQHFTGVIRDITERKRLEEQFRQAHKMEAFGQLAGGVAHDFNNLLTVILGEAEHLTWMLAEQPDALSLSELRTAALEVQQAGERAAGLTRQLLAFSRKTVLEPKILDLNTIVAETEKMLRRLIGEDIALSTSLAPALSHVHVDPGQLAQVLMNLAVNARDAMPSGGQLAIETTEVTLERAACDTFGGALQPGCYVQLTVRDTGTGMTPFVRERAFQPFFTTKGVGEGTGLGLAVVHGIVIQSGGGIRIFSEVGVGTAFEIVLPVARVAQAPRGVAAPEGDATETILVVEDDEAIRRLALRLLSRRGYRVLVASDGQGAIELLRQRGGEVDVVVTDVVMPNMDGRVLGELLAQQYPHIKLLYVSGYTDDMLVRRGLQTTDIELVSKPYTEASLLGAIRRALARRV